MIGAKKKIITTNKEIMKYDFNNMESNGKLARKLGLDPRTLRGWAKKGRIPSYVNPINNYRFYSEIEVLKAIQLDNPNLSVALDENRI